MLKETELSSALKEELEVNYYFFFYFFWNFPLLLVFLILFLILNWVFTLSFSLKFSYCLNKPKTFPFYIFFWYIAYIFLVFLNFFSKAIFDFFFLISSFFFSYCFYLNLNFFFLWLNFLKQTPQNIGSFFFLNLTSLQFLLKIFIFYCLFLCFLGWQWRCTF